MQQLYVFAGLYLILTVVVAFATRARARRILDALAGAAICGTRHRRLRAKRRMVHMSIRRDPYFLALMWIDLILWAYVFLLTWRVARRFGGRGLGRARVGRNGPGTVSGFLVYMARFPEWGSYAPGLTPKLAISAEYVLLGILGHGTMRPAASDRLTRLSSQRGLR